jgi:ubiquinone/menaquinone biosynthesis C-methylase UbiE
LGIPSFCDPEIRISPVEKAVVEELRDLYPKATFEQLLQARLTAYMNSYDLDEKLLHQYGRYTSSLRGRGRRFDKMFRSALTEHLSSPHRGLALDIGCGTGAGAVAMASGFKHIVALDTRMSSLIVAKKLIESEGFSNVTLVRASALQMPLYDMSFDYVVAINVLEHIFEPAVMLAEVHRVLARGGVFAGDSRNRFDLFFPEPHAKLRCVGFLPRRWMASYVQWRRGISYESTHLLSYGDLSRALEA